MSAPTDILRDEHTLIVRALGVVSAAAERLEGGGAVDEGRWGELIEWLRGFADRNHHAKEERLLFPALVRHGVPMEGGPIQVMLDEHAEGRVLLAAMAGEVASLRAAHARKYVDLLRAHIDKENDVLFPMAEAVLDPTTQAALEAEFDAEEARQGNEASLGHAAAALGRIEEALGH